MARNTTLATLGILGALAMAPAVAQAPLDQTVEHASGRNVVGGGGASMNGGGVDHVVISNGTGAGGGARYEQAGRRATFGGNSGEGPFWTYSEPPALNGGREAWLLGGGEDSQVRYINPTGRRR